MAKRKFDMSEQEASFCKNMASRDDLHGKRAKTLLLLNDGLTQTEAGKQTGFSIGQVHYLVRIFKQKGLAVFPEISAEKAELHEKTEPDTIVKTEDEQEVVDTVKEKKKGKSEKNGKKKKKDKKKKKKKKGKVKEKEKKVKKGKKKSKVKKSKKSKGKKKK